MKTVLFCHSVRSDWNHGNAHFLRGVVRSLLRQGSTVDIHEPADGWSVRNLVADHGEAAATQYKQDHPDLAPQTYGAAGPDIDVALRDADVAVVHEWTDPAIVRAIAEHHRKHDNYQLYFHDSHHRALSAGSAIPDLPLGTFTGVLAFGQSLRDHYVDEGIVDHAWTWHEAADTDVFRPRSADKEGDLVWIGNWGDEERTAELQEFLVDPVRRAGLDATVHGVRYPKKAQALLKEAGLDYRGWLANTEAPDAFARHRMTVHVPRRPYLEQLPGIPTIRMFEAFACGIPLIVARWQDAEGLFRPDDYLRAQDGEEMEAHMRWIMSHPDDAAAMAGRALQTLRRKHTCDHRARELQDIVASNRTPTALGQKIAFFGSSLLSSYWNGAATYYRGLLRALAAHGHHVTFYEPDAFDRGAHQDMEAPSWADVVVYPATEEGALQALQQAQGADIVVKASGVGSHDGLLEEQVGRMDARTFFWDVDAPATLSALAEGKHPELAAALPSFDAVFTYGGGPRVVSEYKAAGARSCTPVHNALDPTTHHPVAPEERFQADLAFLGNRLPDREARVGSFFFDVARAMPESSFLLGGAGWDPGSLPKNVRYTGHVETADHNAFNATPRAVLNVNRDSMARYGHSPPTRIFEAAGAGACIITDAWEGIETFLAPDKEILVAHDGDEVAEILASLDAAKAKRIGQAARKRVLRDHTYAQRALQVDRMLRPQEVLA